MKSKTKKLFLTLFMFASLSLAACGGSSGSSSTPAGSSDTSESSSGDGSSSSSSSSEDPVTVIPDIYVKVNNDEAKLDYDDFSGVYAVEEVELVTTDVISVYTKDDEDEPVSLLEKIVFADTDSEALMNAECNGVNEDGTYCFFLAYDEDEDKYALTVIKEAAAVTYTLNVGTTVYKFVETQKDPASEAPNQLHNYVSIQDVEITKNTAFVWKDGETTIDQHIGLNPTCNAVATTEAEHTTFKFHNDADAGKVYFKTWDNEDPNERDGQIHGYSFWIPGYQPNPEDYAPYSLFVGTQEYKMLSTTKDAIDHELANYETENAVTITGDQTFSFKDDNGNVIAANIGPNDGANADTTSTPGVFKFHNDTTASKIYFKTYDHVDAGARDGHVHSYSFWVPGKDDSTPPSTTFASTYKLAYGTAGSSDVTWGWDGAVIGETLEDSSCLDQAKYTVTLDEPGLGLKLRTSTTENWYGYPNLQAGSSSHLEGDSNDNIIVNNTGTFDIYLKKLKSDSSIKIAVIKRGTQLTNLTLQTVKNTDSFMDGATNLYAWAWGGQYGNGLLIPCTFAAGTVYNVPIYDDADGFEFVTTSAAVAEADYDTYPAGSDQSGPRVKQSLPLQIVPHDGTLVLNGFDGSGKGEINYYVPPVETEYKMVGTINGSAVAYGAAASMVNDDANRVGTDKHQWKLLGVELAVNDEFEFALSATDTAPLGYGYVEDPNTQDFVASTGKIKVLIAGVCDIYLKQHSDDSYEIYISKVIPTNATVFTFDKGYLWDANAEVYAWAWGGSIASPGVYIQAYKVSGDKAYVILGDAEGCKFVRFNPAAADDIAGKNNYNYESSNRWTESSNADMSNHTVALP